MGNCGTLLFGSQTRHQLCDQSTGFLGVEITSLLGNIHQSVQLNKWSDNGGTVALRLSHLFVVTLLGTLLTDTALATDLHRLLLALGVAHEAPVALVDIPGRAGRLVHSPALSLSLSIAHLLHGSVALPDRLLHGLLLEGDLAALLEVLLAGLLLCWLEEGDVGVVTLLHVLVFALQDRILGHRLHLLLLDDTQAAVWSPRGLAEVHSSWHCHLLSC